MSTTRRVLLGSLVGALAIYGLLAGQPAHAETSTCTDWEVQWFTPTMPAPIVVAPNRTGPDPRIVAVPAGWEPISGSYGNGIAGYALRRCTH